MVAHNDAILCFSLFGLFVLEAKAPTHKYLLAFFFLSHPRTIYFNFFSTSLHAELIFLHLYKNTFTFIRPN